MKIKTTKHPGFKAVAKKIEGEGYSPKTAAKILASKTRNASAAAKQKNPTDAEMVRDRVAFWKGVKVEA